MSMWCLMAAPLFFSGDMAKLDPFTLNVLCNAEVIDVDQDPLGKQARSCAGRGATSCWPSRSKDGSLAVGLFNLGERTAKLSVTWKELGISGQQSVRDLWRQKDLGAFADGFAIDVPRHGVAMVRITAE